MAETAADLGFILRHFYLAGPREFDRDGASAVFAFVNGSIAFDRDLVKQVAHVDRDLAVTHRVGIDQIEPYLEPAFPESLDLEIIRHSFVLLADEGHLERSGHLSTRNALARRLGIYGHSKRSEKHNAKNSLNHNVHFS